MQERISSIARIIQEEATNRFTSGKYKQYLSVEGYLTLMVDRIERWFETRDDDEILAFAVDALFAMDKIIPKEEEILNDRESKV